MTHKLQVALPIPDGSWPVTYENLWAEPVGWARYRLLNSSFFVPLCVGDEVKALMKHGRPVVTEVLLAGPKVLSITAAGPTISNDEQRSVTEAWRDHGASWTEGAAGILLTVWNPGQSADEIYQFLVDDLRLRVGWGTPAVYSPEDRIKGVTALGIAARVT